MTHRETGKPQLLSTGNKLFIFAIYVNVNSTHRNALGVLETDEF